MKHKYGAVCFAAMLLLTGCVRDGNTDLSERYPAYFRYCFGDDAACQFVKVQDDAEHLYRIAYAGKDDEERSVAVSVLPYDKERAKEYKNAHAYYDVLLESVVMEELASVCAADFVSQVLAKHFDGTVTGSSIQCGDEAKIDVQLLCDVWSGSTLGISNQDKLGAQLCSAHITPVTGWQVCTADWTTAAGDPQWFWTVSATLSAGADAESYLEKLQAAYAEYRDITEEPQSCTFLLRQSEPSGDDLTNLVWRETVLCGETIDTDAMKAESAGYSFWDDVTERLRAYYTKAD